MTVPTAVMLDTIGANAGHIPAGTHYVGAYVTGLGDVPWSVEALARFPHARIVRIAQGAGLVPAYNGYDMIDVENGAITPVQAAAMIADRVSKGITWTTVYGTDATLLEVTDEVRKYGEHIWNGHVNYFLADWNLNAETAATVLGKLIHGASCVGVQWASPESNPNTVTPGDRSTLRVSSVDISVVDSTWIPSGPFGASTPPAPPTVINHGLLVTTDAHGVFSAKMVSTLDNTHWS
jgi:hypothetical protein